MAKRPHRKVELTQGAITDATDLDLDVQEVVRMARLGAPFTGTGDLGGFNRRFEGFLFFVELIGDKKVVSAVGRYDQQQVSRRRRLRSDERPDPGVKELLIMARDTITNLMTPDTDPAVREDAEYVLGQIERSR